MPDNSSVTASRLFPAYVIGGAAAVFYLPYFFPSAPTASSSYLFGYNNRVGVALLLVLVVIGVIWTRGLNLKFLKAGDSPQISSKVLIYSLIAVVLGCAGMYVLAGRYGGFGESAYEIDRIWLASIGKRPYVDFEWPFGVIPLYVPIAFQNLFALSIPQAYYLFWALNCLLGVWLLYAAVNAVDYPSLHKNKIYLLLFCGWFPAIISMGTHYTLTRYALPIYGVLAVQRRLRSGDVSSYVFAILQILFFTIILLLYSPETAIAFGAASVGLFGILAPKRTTQFWAALGGLIVALALTFWIASKLHVLDTIKASGGGADSFPIILSPHILLFFAAVFACACYVYQRFAGGRLDDNTLGLIAFSIPMLPAALGRCDPGHVLFNGLGIFLAALLYASNHARLWRYAKTAFAVVLVVFSTLGGLWFYAPALAKFSVLLIASGDNQGSYVNRLLMNGGMFYINHFGPADLKQRWQERLESTLRGVKPEITDLSVIDPVGHEGYLAPFGYKPNGTGTALTTQVDYGRYEDVENANTPAAINEKIAEMHNNPTKALVLPDKYTSACVYDIHAERQKIELLFAFPYLKAPAHSNNLREPICDYIQEHYSLIEAPLPKIVRYRVWINKDSVTQKDN
jgi:hypothetical protein